MQGRPKHYIEVTVGEVVYIYKKYKGEQQYPYFCMIITPLLCTHKSCKTVKELKKVLDRLVVSEEVSYSVSMEAGGEKQLVPGTELVDVILAQIG